MKKLLILLLISGMLWGMPVPSEVPQIEVEPQSGGYTTEVRTQTQAMIEDARDYNVSLTGLLIFTYAGIIYFLVTD